MDMSRVRRERKQPLAPDRGAKGWMMKYIYKNKWRMPRYMLLDGRLDDLIQEGYLAFYNTLARYPTAIDPPHVMALFKLVFRSRIEVLAQTKTRTVDFAVGDIALDIAELQHPLDMEMSTLFTLVANAPPHILKILELLANDEDCQKLQAPYRRHRDGYRETLNERLCRLTGFPNPDVDLVTEFRNYFRS